MLGAAAAVVLIAALTVALVSGCASARSGLGALSARTAEVGATNNLYLYLNDMDAQAANALLVGFHPTVAVPAADSAASAMDTYETDRGDVSTALQSIALNPALAGRYRSLLTALGAYESLIAQAVYVDQNTVGEKPAAPPAAALALYQQASGQMHDSILPIAAAITGQDTSQVDSAYSASRSAAQRDAILVALLGVLAVGAFAAGNLFLARRFRRVLTPALVLAALVAAAVASSGATLLLDEAGHLKVAKSEAFDSINALTAARAISYDANADESRWLLDPSAALQQDFFAKATRIAAVPQVGAGSAAADPGSYYAGLQRTIGAMTVDRSSNKVADVQITGYLGTELRNITFPGEAVAADQAAKDFDSFIQADQTLRAKEAASPAAAVSFDIGTAPGDSDAAFYQYDNSLRQVIAINNEAFTAAVADGQRALGAWAWLPYPTAVLLILLIGAAVYPRLREYR